MTKPSFPLICISIDKFVDIIPNESFLSKVATSALIDKSVFEDNYSYDSSGTKWTYEQVSYKFKNSFITRLLARTFYNPLLDAKVIWKNVSNYDLQELKRKLAICIDKDDDILTQFEDGEIIKATIEKAANFTDVVAALNKYIFEVDEEIFFNEYEERK